MTNRQKYIGALLVFITLGLNYESQISHLSNAQIAQFSLHDWFGALLNVALSGAVVAKAYLADSGTVPPTSPGPH